MASPNLNLNPLNDDNWFKKPPNLFLFFESLNPFKPQPKPVNFAALSLNPFSRKKPPKNDVVPRKPGKYSKMVDQFFWECENLPDYRHTPEVERILNEDLFFEKKDNPTQKEIEENEEWWREFRSSPVVQFLKRAEEIVDKINEIGLKENTRPYWDEDNELWQALPNVMGVDGRPMPRKAIKTRKESQDKFWDFTKQFFFGLWGFRQRPYPRGRPIDVAQAIGYHRLEKRYYDFIMRTGGYFYKDRLGRTRGPMELIQLKTAWGAGIIDKHTFIWGEDMDEWAPIGMVYGLERAIATWEVRLTAAVCALMHKSQKGIPPWVPLKGREEKTYKQVQEEAVESKKRDLAVLEANDGIWPGLRIPSHALFLWASGTELTSILESDHMPNKHIPKELRYQLAELIPGLRPWEVLSVEQAMDRLTFSGSWYRQPLGRFTTGPPYIQEWNKYIWRFIIAYTEMTDRAIEALESEIPGFYIILDKIQEMKKKIVDKRKQKKLIEQKAEMDKCLDQAGW